MVPSGHLTAVLPVSFLDILAAVKLPKFEPKPNEQVLFPSPFVANEYNPLIVSTNRLIFVSDGKKREVPADKITFAGKGFHKKFMLIMLVLGLIGAPFFGYGAYTYYTSKDKPTEPPAVVKGMPRKPVTAKDLADYARNKNQKILGIVVGVFGAAFLGVAYLLYKRRLTVIIGAGGKALEIPAKDKADQDKILMMVNAATTAAKAMAPPPMPDKVAKLEGSGKPPKLAR